MNKQQAKHHEMVDTKIERLVLKMAWPTVLSMLVSTFYSLIDSFFVGKIGTSAVGAVGVSFSYMTVIQAIGFFFGHGSGNYISFELGKNRREHAKEMAANGFYLALGLAGAIALISFLNLESLSRVLGSTETILPYTVSYLRYIIIASPYMAAALVLNNQLRFQGNTFYGMLGISSGAILNIILDPIFIFQFNLGVSGAAIATMISQFVAFIILLVEVYGSGSLPVHIKQVKLTKLYFGEIFRGGFPSLMRQALTGISTVILNRYAGLYGDVAIAAMTIVGRITIFASSMMVGIGQGFQPVCGFNYGAGKYERVKKAFWFSVKIGGLLLLLMAAVMLAQSSWLIGLFRSDDVEVIRIGSQALRWRAITLPLTSFAVVSNMMMQNIGKVKEATFLAAARQGLFLIPVLMIGTTVGGLSGIIVSQPIADVVTLGVALALQRLELLKLNKLQQISESDKSYL